MSDQYTIPAEDIYPTPGLAEETKDEIIARQANEITTLKSNLESMTNNWEYQRNATNNVRAKIKAFEGYLREHVQNEEIDLDIAKGYADVFDIKLMKKYDVEMTVSFSGTVEVPLDMDEDDIQNQVSFLFDEGYSDCEWDVQEDGVNWEISEAY